MMALLIICVAVKCVIISKILHCLNKFGGTNMQAISKVISIKARISDLLDKRKEQFWKKNHVKLSYSDAIGIELRKLIRCKKKNEKLKAEIEKLKKKNR